MKERIKEFINNPEKLEQLYQDDKIAFRAGFEEAYAAIDKYELSKFWKIRLDYNKLPEKIKKSNLQDIFIMILACLITGFLIKIPNIFNIRMTEIFYWKNAGIIVFFGLTFYTLSIKKIYEIKRLTPVIVTYFVLTLYVNLLPSVTDSDSINLVYFHLPLLMWCIFGLVHIDFNINDKIKRIEFIRYNGDMAILMALIVITGGILTGITVGLFGAIGINIENFYMKNVVIIGAVSVPIVAAYILKNYNELTNKIAPIIANIFSPLVLLTAIIFLSGPRNFREGSHTAIVNFY